MCSRPASKTRCGDAVRRLAAAAVLPLAALGGAPAAAADWLAHVRSTDSAIFQHNLDDRLASLQQRAGAGALPEAEARELARLLYLRGQLLNDVGAMEQALAVLRPLPASAAVSTQRASIQLSLHRFDDAAAELAQHGARDAGREAAVLQAELWWNRGRTREAWQLLEQVLADSRNPLLYARKAGWLIAQGRLAAAQQQLDLARSHLTDPHPVPAVWLYLGQARLLSAQGRHDEAYAVLLSAQRRLPRHVPLLEALAAAERRNGLQQQAIERLRLAIALSPDPHLPMQLARLLPPAQRAPWLAEAERRFAQMARDYAPVYAAEAAAYYLEQARHAQAAQALSLLPPAARGLHDWVLAAAVEAAGGRRQQALDALRAARASGQFARAPYCRAAALYAALDAPAESAALAETVTHQSGRPCPANPDLEEEA